LYSGQAATTHLRQGRLVRARSDRIREGAPTSTTSETARSVALRAGFQNFQKL